MKTMIVLLIACVGIFLPACTGNTKTPVNANEAKVVPHYRCPMKCEGEKTYDRPGNCPVCGMELEAGDTTDHVSK